MWGLRQNEGVANASPLHLINKFLIDCDHRRIRLELFSMLVVSVKSSRSQFKRTSCFGDYILVVSTSLISQLLIHKQRVLVLREMKKEIEIHMNGKPTAENAANLRAFICIYRQRRNSLVGECQTYKSVTLLTHVLQSHLH